MKHTLLLILLVYNFYTKAQIKQAADFGFRHFRLSYEKDTVDILLQSKKGDELKTKPVFLFCQGSLPIPLIITSQYGVVPSFPFDTNVLCENYHLAIIGKPGIPLITDISNLQEDLTYLEESTHRPPLIYLRNDHLGYYVNRNLAVIEFLCNQKFVSTSSLVVSGHSQGARIALEMASASKKITHLIYASGNPCGQIMSMIARARQQEDRYDTTTYVDNDFRLYEAIVADSTRNDTSLGENFKSIYSFSASSIQSFSRIQIPTFICYGSLDIITPFNDYLRAELIRQRKKNFTFRTYVGLNHNYMGLLDDGTNNYDDYNWDLVAQDWLNWLNNNR